MRTRTISHVALVAIASALFAGCASEPAKQDSVAEVQKVRSAYSQAAIGATRADTLGLFKDAGVTKLSSASVRGTSIEEYKVEAYYDDDWNKSRDLFVAFLYFAEGRLVQSSDRRIDYLSDPSIVESWKSAAPGS